MKRAIAAVFALAYCSATMAEEKLTVLCYGDSITAAEEGWVSLIDSFDSVEAVNAGKNGRRAVNAKEELVPYFLEYHDQEFDRILLCLGVNDLPARDTRPGDVKVGICVQGMREAIDLALTRFAPVQITLVAPCDVNPDDMNEINLGKGYQVTPPLLKKLESAYQDLAAEKGVSFLSLLDTVSSENYTDGLHPNRVGHEEIAAAVSRYLEI